MKVKFEPQVFDGEVLINVSHEIIRVKLGEKVYKIDVTSYPNGSYKKTEPQAIPSMVDLFDIFTILKDVVKTEHGTFITLVKYCTPDATEGNLYSEWIDTKDFKNDFDLGEFDLPEEEVEIRWKSQEEIDKEHEEEEKKKQLPTEKERLELLEETLLLLMLE